MSPCRSCTNPGAAVITLGSAAWLKQGLTATKVPVRPMKTEFMLASDSLQRSCSSDEADSGAEAQALPGAWEVAVKQVWGSGLACLWFRDTEELGGEQATQRWQPSKSQGGLVVGSRTRLISGVTRGMGPYATRGMLCMRAGSRAGC